MSGLTKVTVNLTPAAEAALTKLAAIHTNRTDAINFALRLAALMTDLAPEGRFTIVQPDGSHDRVHPI
ncbi:hypothetical protein [Micromonospora sp. NBC_01796]|uniref:hypothetical protein n=1 Tax=Micromonospora sp. NBC_01796 TaxID=2975987 RepID=UPI002DDBD923|nr:hypothetical protein [Micromonospora sp. NBC_01796]WSA86361.1 hypothetical protein OIE47_01700 [Micromonospora sp. NBC_01796]